MRKKIEINLSRVSVVLPTFNEIFLRIYRIFESPRQKAMAIAWSKCTFQCPEVATPISPHILHHSNSIKWEAMRTGTLVDQRDRSCICDIIDGHRARNWLQIPTIFPREQSDINRSTLRFNSGKCEKSGRSIDERNFSSFPTF